MRRTGVYVAMLLLGGGLLGALAQERSAPWPPAPVPPPKEPAPAGVMNPALPAENPGKLQTQPTFQGGSLLTIKPPAPIPAGKPVFETAPKSPQAEPRPARPIVPITEITSQDMPGPVAEPRQSPPKPERLPSAPEVPRLFPDKTVRAIPLPSPPAEGNKTWPAPNGTAGETHSIAPVQQLGADPLPLPPTGGPGLAEPPAAVAPRPAAPETDPGPRRPPAFRLVGDPQPAAANAKPLEPSYRTQYAHPTQETLGAAAVTVAKSGPATAVLGQPLPYVIAITNVGQLPVRQLQVVDELPPGTRFLKASSPPRVLGDKLTWLFEPLLPGEKREIHVEVLPAAAGEWSGQVTAMLAISSSLRILVTEAPLAVKVTGPERLSVGQVARFELQAKNNGREPVGNLVISVQLPAGLSHPIGGTIEAVVGDLAPGGSKTFPLPLTVAAPGSYQLTCYLQAGDEKMAVGHAVLEATASPLEIRGRGPSQLLLDHAADVQIQVANHTSKPAKNVVVTATLPEGLEYLQASDRGLYRATTRSVHWMLDYLPAGGSHSLTLRLEAKAPGQHAPQLSARAEEGEEARGSIPLLVEGVTNLGVKVVDRDDPLEVGKETVYEIRVHNQGTAPATHVQVQVALPEGMQPTTAKGPVNLRLEGKTVTFAALPRLEPRTQAVFVVTALALAPGDNRCRVQVTCDQNRVPITREERTWIYQD